MMRKIIFGLVVAAIATAAYAGCYTNNVVTPDGRLIVCTTCCYDGSGCTTTCSQ